MLSAARPLDASTLAAVAQGDRRAFRALYDATAPKLFGIALRIVQDRALAEEVLQDVYLRVWRNAASYAAEAGEPMAWLSTIARYRAIDVKRQRREVLVGPNEDGQDWLDGVPDGRDAEAAFVEGDGLRRCLGRLEDTQRACVVLAYQDGLSREELAERFGRPVNTIKTWLHRGLNTLRACLDET